MLLTLRRIVPWINTGSLHQGFFIAEMTVRIVEQAREYGFDFLFMNGSRVSKQFDQLVHEFYQAMMLGIHRFDAGQPMLVPPEVFHGSPYFLKSQIMQKFC